jgi:hypothetical protein
MPGCIPCSETAGKEYMVPAIQDCALTISRL